MEKYNANQILKFLFPLFFIIGIVFIVLGLNNTKIINITSQEDNSIHYKVYLKENEFFDTPYLEENRTYIATLIDYININFHYSIEYSRKLTGIVTYEYAAIVRANKKEGDGYYWEKEYPLSDAKKLDIDDSNNIEIDDSINVSYSNYNQILSDFKKEYGITTDGELKVVMKIKNNADIEDSEEMINTNNEIGLSIPLLEQSLEVSINKDMTNDNNILTFKEKSSSPIYIILEVLGLILISFALMGIILTIRNTKRIKKYKMYEITLDKILKNYDSIIANVNNLPDVRNSKVIDVSTFEELMDVYNEVRMPINFYQNKRKSSSAFVIINDDVAWTYVLRKKDFLKRADTYAEEETQGKS